MKYRVSYFNNHDSQAERVTLILKQDYISIQNDLKNTEFRWAYNDIVLSGEPRPAVPCKITTSTSPHSWVSIESVKLWKKINNKVRIHTKSRSSIAAVLFTILCLGIVSIAIGVLYISIYRPDLYKLLLSYIHDVLIPYFLTIYPGSSPS